MGWVLVRWLLAVVAVVDLAHLFLWLYLWPFLLLVWNNSIRKDRQWWQLWSRWESVHMERQWQWWLQCLASIWRNNSVNPHISTEREMPIWEWLLQQNTCLKIDYLDKNFLSWMQICNFDDLIKQLLTLHVLTNFLWVQRTLLYHLWLKNWLQKSHLLLVWW